MKNLNTNPLETLHYNFDNLPNASEAFTGDPNKPLLEEYPEKFTFAFNPDYGIDENITYNQVVADNAGTKRYLSFPYGVYSDVNYNEYRWAIYINEIIGKFVKAFEASKNSADITYQRTKENNRKLKENFENINKDFVETIAQSLEGDVYRFKKTISRNPNFHKIGRKSDKSLSYERIGVSEWKLNQIVFDIMPPDGFILKDSVVTNRNIVMNTISSDKMKYPTVRQIRDSEPKMKSEDFAGTLQKIEHAKSVDLTDSTRNDLLGETSPEMRFKKIQTFPTNISYKNIYENFDDTLKYIELMKPLVITTNPLTTDLLQVIGNSNYISVDPADVFQIHIFDQTFSDCSFLNELDVISSIKFNATNVTFNENVTIESPKLKLKDCKFEKDLTIKIDLTNVEKNNNYVIEDVSVKNLNIEISYDDALTNTPTRYLTLRANYDIIKFTFTNLDLSSIIEFDLSSPTTIDKRLNFITKYINIIIEK